MDRDKMKRIEIFEDTTKLFKSNNQLKNDIEFSKKNTKLYKEDFDYNLPENPNKNCKISVINSRTFKASEGLDNVVVLNFASATNPGGGVKTGSNAQEECLCRCSTLYPCLTSGNLFNDYYKYHRDRKDTFYTDRIIYSKDITVFKEDIREPILMDEDKWYKVDIITSPAPNLREVKKVNQNELLQIFKTRIEKILKVAIINGNTNIVLGAFGCGAFKNPPFLVARAYKEVLDKYKVHFDNIVFAVLITPGQNGDENFKTFSKVIK